MERNVIITEETITENILRKNSSNQKGSVVTRIFDQEQQYLLQKNQQKTGGTNNQVI